MLHLLLLLALLYTGQQPRRIGPEPGRHNPFHLVKH